MYTLLHLFLWLRGTKTNVNWLSGSDRETEEACCELTATIHVKMLISTVRVSSKWDNQSAEPCDKKA